jgi:hypothetical protein
VHFGLPPREHPSFDAAAALALLEAARDGITQQAEEPRVTAGVIRSCTRTSGVCSRRSRHNPRSRKTVVLFK